jgi:acyl-ACP thioesterase
MNVFKKEFAISSYDLDPKGQARLTTMANFFQEVAYHHARELGWGYHEMKSRKTTWVLSRMRIHMKRYPEWNEQITMETWPSGAEKLFALRDFRVADHKGDVIGWASTAWLILDIDTHRLIRPKEMMDRFKLIIHDTQVYDTPLGRIDIPGQTRQLSEHRVLFSDLDIVGHVNNVKYMEWCLDVATNSGNIRKDLLELEINFNHEALFGDLIHIAGSEEEGNFYFMAVREGDGQEIFRARLQRNS